MKLTEEEKKLKKQCEFLYKKKISINSFSDPEAYLKAEEEYRTFYRACPNSVTNTFKTSFNSPKGRKLLKDLPFYTS